MLPTRNTAKYDPAVEGYDDRKDDQVHHGKQYIQRLVGKEMFYAGMVANALKHVANHLGIKKTDGQTHQFDQEIGDQGYIQTGRQDAVKSSFG